MEKQLCRKCGEPLPPSLEYQAGDYIVRCLACGAANVVMLIPIITGWR